MKNKIFYLILITIISSFCYFSSASADNSKVEVRGSVDDGTTTLETTGLITKYFTSGARQQQQISLTASAFTAITVPSGARAVIIDMLSADGIKLKGLTGDQGISLDSVVPIVLPLSGDGTVTIGIQNLETTAQTIRVFWF